MATEGFQGKHELVVQLFENAVEREKRVEEQFHNEHYGVRLPTFTPVSNQDKPYLLGRCEERLLPRLKVAHVGVVELLQTLHSGLIDYGDRSAEYWLARYVWDREVVPTKRALHLLHEKLEVLKEDPRPALYVFYIKYNSLREWVIRFADLLGKDLPSMTHFATWRPADEALLQDFDELLLNSNFRELAQAIRQTEGFRQEPITMPQPAAPPQQS